MGGGRGMGGGGGGGQREPGAGVVPQGSQTGSWFAGNRSAEEQNPETSPFSRTGLLSDVVAVVDEKLCLGCGTCRLVCPAGAIRMEAVAVVRGDVCTGCGSCVEACTHKAISLQEQQRG